MQCDDPATEQQVQAVHLEPALLELEVQKKRVLNIVEMNTRFVSDVTIGWKVRPMLATGRYRPYTSSRERHRTKSENADVAADSTSISRNILEDLLAEQLTVSEQPKLVLKKAISLESIVPEVDEPQLQLPEAEITKCIQKLRVGE